MLLDTGGTYMVEIKKCSICGQIVGVIKKTDVSMICCGKPMDRVVANEGDGAFEKHIPYVTCEDGKHLHIQIGETLHPALDFHHIEWIIVETNLRTLRYPLNPTEEPKRTFELELKLEEKAVAVYEHCNIHGLYVKRF